MTTVPLLVYAVNQKNHKKMSAFTQELWRKTATARSPLFSPSSPRRDAQRSVQRSCLL